MTGRIEKKEWHEMYCKYCNTANRSLGRVAVYLLLKNGKQLRHFLYKTFSKNKTIQLEKLNYGTCSHFRALFSWCTERRALSQGMR